MENKLKNYGFVKPIHKEGDYTFAAKSLPRIPINTKGDWTDFAPVYEPQTTKDGDETDGCGVWGTQNAIETYLKFLTGKDYNFSERMIYILAGVKPPGSNPFDIAECIRTDGMVDNDVLPMTDTYEEFVQPNPIPQLILDKAKETFLAPFTLKHESLFYEGIGSVWKAKMLSDVLQYSPIGVSLCAWFQDADGLYYRPDGYLDTHWCVLLKQDVLYDTVFDSYDQKFKKVRKDMDYGYAERYYITQNIFTSPNKPTLLQNIWGAIISVLSLLKDPYHAMHRTDSK